MKKNFKYILLVTLLGIFFGKYIFSKYEDNSIQVMKTDEEIYLIEYGAYKSKDIMIDNAKNLKNYFYYSDKNTYYVIIGITKNKKLKDKIVDAYEIDQKVILKKLIIDNQDFLQSLNQYDELIDQTTDKDVILNSQKQILSKYEELVSNE